MYLKCLLYVYTLPAMHQVLLLTLVYYLKYSEKDVGHRLSTDCPQDPLDRFQWRSFGLVHSSQSPVETLRGR
jgi:hypothetical protein